MSVPKKLISYLEKNKAKYELLEHRTVFTAWDLAQTLHVKPGQIVKTLVCKIKGKTPILVNLAADKNLDKKKLANVIKAHADKLVKTDNPPSWVLELKGKSYKIDFAKEAWMKQKMLGKVGATPAFGVPQKLPVFMDKTLEKQAQLILNSGDYNTAIKITAAQFKKLENPLTGSFSLKR